ncbi:MAG: hypothetical protein OEM77_03470 [Nitrosopumilus sp.]|nr:hypothetical protein [Nitrosopumilus sp.]MDH3736133.1 hypothetical protein [Nitrosopumilus sp.]MDH3822554.1 hypothetical protein [Nitrosopumilus sp.]MDH3833292.1 hypothetical protein [Nitrosopumilus sp.]
MSKLMNQTSQDEIRGKYIQRFQEMLSEYNDKLSKSENPEETSKFKQNITGLEKSIECAKVLPVVRDPRVPKNIPDHSVWNDSWYDEERKVYVTLNEYFMQGEDAWFRPHQKQYTQETGIEAVIILPKQIEFRFGYPVMFQKDSNEKPTWYLLSTLTEDMLTKEIVKAKFNPILDENSALYRTKSESWIDVLDDHLTEREYILACEVMPYLVKTPMEVLKAVSGRPYDQKLYQQQMFEINQQQK